MSYDIAIWKRSARTKTAMLSESYEAILEGKDHTAMNLFDETVFFKDMEAEYGIQNDEYFGAEIDDCPFLYSQGGGEFGNWILFNLNWSTCQETQNKIIPIALKHDLMVYDPQKGTVWGNKRPVVQKKK